MSTDEYHGHPVQSALGYSISGHSHAGGLLPHDHPETENLTEARALWAEDVARPALLEMRNTPHVALAGPRLRDMAVDALAAYPQPEKDKVAPYLDALAHSYKDGQPEQEPHDDR